MHKTNLKSINSFCVCESFFSPGRMKTFGPYVRMRDLHIFCTCFLWLNTHLQRFHIECRDCVPGDQILSTSGIHGYSVFTFCKCNLISETKAGLARTIDYIQTAWPESELSQPKRANLFHMFRSDCIFFRILLRKRENFRICHWTM